MAEAAGEGNFFLFGLTAEEVAGSRGWYSPQWHYDNEPETRAAMDLIAVDLFSRRDPGIFAPIHDTLLKTETTSCIWPTCPPISAPTGTCAISTPTPAHGSARPFSNIASSGKFSSDRSIAEYATHIWHVEPYPVD
jgi:starch phosphorylase